MTFRVFHDQQSPIVLVERVQHLGQVERFRGCFATERRCRLADRLLGRQLSQPDNVRFLKHLRKHQDQLLTFLRDDGVDATNNAAERALRPAVIARKTTGGHRTHLGAWTHEVLASVSATCQLRDLPYLPIAHSAYRGHPPNLSRKT